MLDEGVRERWASGGRSSRNLAGGEPRPRGWHGRREETVSRAQGQPGLPLPGVLVAGASPPPWCFVRTSLSLGDCWEGSDKDHLAKQDCLSIIPSHLGEEGGVRGNRGPELDTWLPLQCSFCLI